MIRLNYFNYYTEIEEHFAKRRGKYLLMSPLDWSLVDVWKDSGVPLNVAIRGIDRAFDKFDARGVKDRLVNRLFYCHQAVMEAFAEHKEAYVGASAAERAELTGDTTAAQQAAALEREKLTRWLTQTVAELEKSRERALAENRSRSAEVIPRVLDRLRELLAEAVHFQPQAIPYENIERDLTILDRLLLEAVQGELSDELRDGWHAEAKRELKMYKQNLPKETYDRILENYIHKRIRLHFDLPALSLFFL